MNRRQDAANRDRCRSTSASATLGAPTCRMGARRPCIAGRTRTSRGRLGRSPDRSAGTAGSDGSGEPPRWFRPGPSRCHQMRRRPLEETLRFGHGFAPWSVRRALSRFMISWNSLRERRRRDDAVPRRIPRSSAISAVFISSSSKRTKTGEQAAAARRGRGATGSGGCAAGECRGPRRGPPRNRGAR